MTASFREISSIEDAVIAWIVEVFPSGRAILANPNAPRPELPYVSAQVTDVQGIGFDDIGAVDLDTGYAVIYGDRIVTISLNAYGSGALNKIRQLVNSISKPSILAVLKETGLSPQMPGPVNDLTQFLETDEEERAHVDVNFGVKDVDLDDVGVIEHVTGNGSIVTETGARLLFSFAADLE